MVNKNRDKMKVTIYLFIYFFICSCSNSNYYGYVYDFDTKKPLEGVKVSDSNNKERIVTDKKGYFVIKRSKNSSSTLIFLKEHYHNDTIPSVSIQSGELMEERFKGEIIYLFNEKSRFKDSIINSN